MKKIGFILLAVILFGAITVRLYRFDSPIADWHAWRQADTSAVSRNFVQRGFDILHPRFDDLSNVPSGKDNPEGFRFVEFPLYNIAQAGFFILFDFFTLEQWGRIVTIISSLFSIVFLYGLVSRYANRITGLFASFFFAFLPYSIYYGRTLLPDSSMVMAILGGIYFFDRWLSTDVILRPKAEESQRGSFSASRRIRMTTEFILAIIFTACAFLLKPYALFFTLPIIYIAFEKFGFSLFKKWQLWLFMILSIMPLLLWRLWMNQYPEGIPVSNWLFNEGNIRFKGAFFYWLFAERIAKLILGYWGGPLLIFGIFAVTGRNARSGWFFLSFLISSLVYLTVIARGNVQHDYYQIAIIPTIAIFLGLGAHFLLFSHKEGFFNKRVSYFIVVLCSFWMIAFGWYLVRDYFNINNKSVVVAGAAVDRLTPKDAKVIAPYDGDTTFLYQTNRRGWASFQDPLPILIKKGAQFLVLVNPQEKDREIGKTYPIVSETKDYILFDLRILR